MDVPDMSGRQVIVTGGNSGIGFETAAALAGAVATSPSPAARDGETARRLWAESERLTGLVAA